MVELGVFQQEPARAGTQRGEDILVDVEFIGDAVVAVFGAPVSHEDDPERAVRAALRVLEATELDVRIAGNTGEVLVDLDSHAERGEGMVRATR
jgi:class 3 adenylate cyclase